MSLVHDEKLLQVKCIDNECKYSNSKFIVITNKEISEVNLDCENIVYFLSNYLYDKYPDDDDIRIEYILSTTCYYNGHSLYYIYYNNSSSLINTELVPQIYKNDKSFKNYKYKISFNLNFKIYDSSSNDYTNFIKIYDHPYIMPDNDKFNNKEFIYKFDINKSKLLEEIKLSTIKEGTPNIENYITYFNSMENNNWFELIIDNYKLQLIKFSDEYSDKHFNIILRNLEVFTN